jgi:hypothetical protein
MLLTSASIEDSADKGIQALMALTGDTAAPAQREKPAPALKLNFLSHGTLESRHLAFSRRFYEEFLGSKSSRRARSLFSLIGRPQHHCRRLQQEGRRMNLLNHNGLDVPTQEEVDEAHRIVCAQAEEWHIKKITKPHLQHGTYSFFFWEGDDNCWEILTNPKVGYSWLFEQGDQQGKGHLNRNLKRPGVVIWAGRRGLHAAPGFRRADRRYCPKDMELRRRDLFAVLGGAAMTAPILVRAQPKPMPVIGLLHQGPLDPVAQRVQPRAGRQRHQRRP